MACQTTLLAKARWKERCRWVSMLVSPKGQVWSRWKWCCIRVDLRGNMPLSNLQSNIKILGCILSFQNLVHRWYCSLLRSCLCSLCLIKYSYPWSLHHFRALFICMLSIKIVFRLVNRKGRVHKTVLIHNHHSSFVRAYMPYTIIQRKYWAESPMTQACNRLTWPSQS